MNALFLRGDFPELIDTVAVTMGMNPAIVEKDYYVTEALRAIAKTYAGSIIFKGGTSLSKGWGLIDRFSEDIDLYINPGDRGSKAKNTLLKAVIDCAASHPAFLREPMVKQRIDGVARSVRLPYTESSQRGFLEPSILIELGVQSGTFPCEERPLTSILANALRENGTAPDQEDCRPFQMNLLHFRRTAVEKMFALHDKVERGLLQEGKPVGPYARHYYDLSQLLGQSEVQKMLKSPEFVEIARDYYAVTSKYFPNQLFPENLRLAGSMAFFPTKGLRASLAKDYEQQCMQLCFREFPSFTEVLGMFEEARHCLEAVHA